MAQRSIALNENILWLHELRLADLARVGGKNSSLGEMIGHLAGLGVSVPGGYATTTCPSASSTSWLLWTWKMSMR